MKYLNKLQQVEAEPVELGGERLMVLKADGGRVQVMPADVFELFFTPETPKEEADRKLVEVVKAAGFTTVGKTKPKKPNAPAPRQVQSPTAAPPADTEAEGSNLTTGEAIMRAVAEGPLTQTETIERVCELLGWDYNDKEKRNRVYGNLWNRIHAGAIVKRECPTTNLSKLYLPGGAK